MEMDGNCFLKFCVFPSLQLGYGEYFYIWPKSAILVDCVE